MSGRRGDGFWWRGHARRIRLWSPVAAALLTFCACGVANAFSSRLPALERLPIVALILNQILSVAGAVTGSLLAAPSAARERWRAVVDGAAWGTLGYWLALVAITLLVVPLFLFSYLVSQT